MIGFWLNLGNVIAKCSCQWQSSRDYFKFLKLNQINLYCPTCALPPFCMNPGVTADILCLCRQLFWIPPQTAHLKVVLIQKMQTEELKVIVATFIKVATKHSHGWCSTEFVIGNCLNDSLFALVLSSVISPHDKIRLNEGKEMYKGVVGGC